MTQTYPGLGRPVCHACRRAIPRAYDPDEEDTGRSAPTMRLYTLWLAAFDRMTDAQRTALLDVVSAFEGQEPQEQALMVATICGDGMKAKLDARRLGRKGRR